MITVEMTTQWGVLRVVETVRGILDFYLEDKHIGSYRYA